MPGRRPIRVTEWRREVVSQQAAILADLSASYPIDSLQPLEGPFWNAAFRGVGRDGECFVKVFNEETTAVPRTVGDLEAVALAIEDLYRGGFRALARPKRSFSGEPAVRCGRYLAMVFEWIEAMRPALDESSAQLEDTTTAWAIILGRLHETGRRLQPLPEGLGRREVPPAYTPTRWACELDRIWTDAEHRVRQRGGGQTSLEQLRQARSLCERLVASQQSFFRETPSDPTILHGDFRPENLIRGAENMVIDFDMVHIGPLEAELAYASLSFAGPRWFIGPRSLDVCAAFVRAYRHASAVAIDLSHLGVAFEYVLLKALSLSFKEEQIRNRMALFRELRGPLDALLTQLG